MRKRFDKQGLLAINPQAFFELYLEAADRSNTVEGDVAIVDIQGPLEQHADGWCDSYEAILERVGLACESAARTVVLRIDSPGGVASGMVDAARTIRAKCQAAGKRLVSYVDGQACSAAYALACAAPEIVASDTAIVGSIGVINCRVDVSEADKMSGLRFAIVMSGARKADGHPHSAVSEAELASTQRLVDSLASTFYELVEELRGIPRAKVAGFEAGLFHGTSAIDEGLVGRVQSFSGLLVSLASAQPAEGSMSKKYDDARAALGELAGGEGEEAAKARKALSAMDEAEEKPDAEGDEEKPDAEGDEEKPDAEGDDAPADDEKKKDPPAAAAAASSTARVSASTAGALAAQSNSLAARVARLEAQNEALERRQFLSSRPDLAPGLVRLLEGKPLAEVRAIVDEIPVPKKPKLGDLAAASRVTPTAGKDSGTPSRLPPAEKAALDAAMGLSAKQSIGVEKSAHLLVLGAPVDARKAG